jgi:hypothetical protein
MNYAIISVGYNQGIQFGYKRLGNGPKSEIIPHAGILGDMIFLVQRM